MSGQKKSGCKKSSLEKILLATAVLNLIEKLLEIIQKLIE